MMRGIWRFFTRLWIKLRLIFVRLQLLIVKWQSCFANRHQRQMLLDTVCFCRDAIAQMKLIEATLRQFEAFQNPQAYERVSGDAKAKVVESICFEVDGELAVCIGARFEGCKHWMAVIGEAKIRRNLPVGSDYIERHRAQLTPAQGFAQALRMMVIAREIMASPKAIRPNESASFARLLIAKARQNIQFAARDMSQIYGEVESRLKLVQAQGGVKPVLHHKQQARAQEAYFRKD